MQQSVNNSPNSTVNQNMFNFPTIEAANAFLQVLQQLNKSNVVITYGSMDKLNNLYNRIGNIIDSFDSMFFITEAELKKLKSCKEQMDLFKDDFIEESGKGKIFYKNYFNMLLRINEKEYISEYENAPLYAKNELYNKYVYSIALYEIGRKSDAINIIDEIISVSNDEKFYIQKGYFYFLNDDTNNLKKLLSKRNKKNEQYGYYGLFELYIQYSKNKDINILKKLNRKYKSKPIYHLYFAQLIYKIDKKQNDFIKENIKNAYFNINDNDLFLTEKLIDTAIKVHQEEYALKLLGKKRYNSFLIESKILIMFINLNRKYNDDENKRILEIIKELEDKDIIDIDFVKAKIALNSNKELEAIDYFDKSYDKDKTIYKANYLVRLIVKKYDTRHFDNLSDYIMTLENSHNPIDYMIISDAYLMQNNIDKALENLYIAAIISGNMDFFAKLWVIKSTEKKENNNVEKVTLNSVIEIKNSKEVLKISLDKNIPNKFDIHSYKGVLFNDNSNFEIDALGKNISDKVNYKGIDYEITKIADKYDYFLKLIFPLLIESKYLKPITGNDNTDLIEKIKLSMLESKKRQNKVFKQYDLETGSGLPLSFFVNNAEKTYQLIMMELLFYNFKSKLYAGNIGTINDNKIIIDITSLVMLEQFNLLQDINNSKLQIYVTQSTINTLKKNFTYQLNHKGNELSIGIDEKNNLVKQELTEDDFKKSKEFWRNIVESVSKFNKVNYESTLDKGKLESCQIDTIDYSVNNNCILVMDDLMLRKVATSLNNSVINSTNFLAIAEILWLNKDNYKKYIDLIHILSKGNYIYCLDVNSFMNIINFSMNDDECQEKVYEIIESIFSTKFLFNIYIEIVVRTIVLVYYNFDKINNTFINTLIKKTRNYCKKYNDKRLLDYLNEDILTFIRNNKDIK